DRGRFEGRPDRVRTRNGFRSGAIVLSSFRDRRSPGGAAPDELPMTPERPQKKSDTLEVRLPHETKQAFMARCRQDGRSASEVIRDFIDGYVARASTPPA